MRAETVLAADLAEIRRAVGLILEPSAVGELRVLETRRDGTASGYFDDPDVLTRETAAWSGQAPGVYVTLNRITPALIARAHNRMKLRAKQTTSDRDVLRRRWLGIDGDPVRPAGISATDAEKAAALDRVQAVRVWLLSEGWPEPILADSGNGGHLLLRIDLPNDAPSTKMIERCLEALAFRFDDDHVLVDQSVFNASRIWKIYGTVAAKGDPTAERPHRLAKLLNVPDQLEARNWNGSQHWPRLRQSRAPGSPSTSTSTTGWPLGPTSSRWSPPARGRGAAGNGSWIPAPGTRSTRTGPPTSSSLRAGPWRPDAFTTGARERIGPAFATGSSQAGAAVARPPSPPRTPQLRLRKTSERRGTRAPCSQPTTATSSSSCRTS
jgi:hypothetical protein